MSSPNVEIKMTVSSKAKTPSLMRSAASSYGAASSAYEKLTEKNNQSSSFLSSIDLCNSNNGNIAPKFDDEFTVGSLSSVLLSFDHHNYVSEDEASYTYSYSVDDENGSVASATGEETGRLGIAPNDRNPYTRDDASLSISPVKKREDNDTIDIPGCSDWSFDISRMSLPSNTNNTHSEIAQDAAKPGINDRSPNSSNTSTSNISALNQQVEWLALRLESLENAIRTNNDTLPSHNQNIAFIAEEDESTVESLTNDIVLPREGGNPDEGGVRRKKRSLFMRFCFFGGCKN